MKLYAENCNFDAKIVINPDDSRLLTKVSCSLSQPEVCQPWAILDTLLIILFSIQA